MRAPEEKPLLDPSHSAAVSDRIDRPRLGSPADFGRQPSLPSGQADRAIHLNVYSMHYGTLTVPEQRALHLVEVRGASYREVGTKLGMGRDAVRRLVYDGRRKILRCTERTRADLREARSA